MNKNEELRQRFNFVMEENGLLLNFVSKKTGIVCPSLSRWRYGHFDFGPTKLKSIAAFCEKYN